MTHFIAIADQNRGEHFEVFEGETLDAAFAAAAASFGEAYPADASIEDNSTGYNRLHLRDVHTREFWFTVMAHEFSRNDNREWSFGTDRATVEGEAREFLGLAA